MSTSKRVRLGRLVRVAQIIYRREAAELARRQLAAREAGEIAAEAEQRIDVPLTGGDFLSQLSVVHAVRARQKHAAADAQVHVQLETTMDALSKKKGTESELDINALEIQKLLVSKDSDELLERIARPQKTSPG